MIRIATRSSPLALWQAEYVKAQLQQHCQQHAEIVPYLTEGDKKLSTSLAWKGGKGLFIQDIHKALQTDAVDIAVHSMKDVPIESSIDFVIPAILERASPYDVLISKHYSSIQDLPQGAVVGTSSLRRQGQLKYAYPHLNMRLLRGNINTRVNKCLQGEYDAIILAEAGIERMQMRQHIKQVLSTDLCLPAIAQGAIGVECLANSTPLIAMLRQLDHPSTRLCVSAEREFSRHLGGGCHSPIACYAVLEGDWREDIFIRAMVTDAEGMKKLSHHIRGACSQYHRLVRQLTEKMIVDGALSLIA